MSGAEWNFEWDPTLYAGSAEHYAVGRMAYPVALAEAVRDELGLDGTGRLLDVGCGPGALTLLFAPYVEEVVGVDADGDMLTTAARRAEQAGIGNASWRQLRAEELPADLGSFRVVMFAQSFHWMDRPLVADRVRGMLTSDGAWVHIGATTHRGLDGTNALPHPRPPWNDIGQLVTRYLGSVRRAGQGVAPTGVHRGEEDVMRAAGYSVRPGSLSAATRSRNVPSTTSLPRSSHSPARPRTCSARSCPRSRRISANSLPKPPTTTTSPNNAGK